jgi:hypothetical protein
MNKDHMNQARRQSKTGLEYQGFQPGMLAAHKTEHPYPKHGISYSSKW